MQAIHRIAFFLTTLGLLGCGREAAKTGGMLKPNFVASAASRTTLSLQLIERLSLERAINNVAQTSGTSISSLQYFVREIQLCQDVTLSGTGYSNASGCLTIYATPDTSASSSLDFYNNYVISSAVTDTNPDHFIDFMTAEGLAKLNKPITLDSTMVRTYKYGKIDFFRPIKIKAQFVDPDGGKHYYTKAGGTIVDGGTDSGGRKIEYLRFNNSTANVTTGPEELMTYMLNNGGAVFAFQKPFEITQADIDNKTDVKVDFVFNPDSFAAVSESATCSRNQGPVVDTDKCIFFSLPYAKMAPVARKTGEKTRKEVYTVSFSDSNIRIDLYYNDADTFKSIQGLDSTVVAKANAASTSAPPISSYKVSESNNVVTIYGYNDSTQQLDQVNLEGLDRRTSGNVTITCVYTVGECSAKGQKLTKAYTYVGDFLVSSD